MKRYDSYKDSGVEWIGEIPSHWSLKKIKEVFQNRNEKNDEMCEDFLSITRDRGVIPYSEKGNIGNKTSDDIGKYKRVYPNDIVINPMNIIIGSVGISKYSGVLSNVYIVLESFGIHPVYGSFIFHMTSFQKHLKKICYGIMELRESLNKIEFFVEQIPVPPLSEQQQIVSFLDSKTSQIDELIQKKERKIELLKEYRTSLINQVVTKGLNPNVEMKDSVVEWIGEIPSHWVVLKIKYGVNHLTEKGTPGKDDIKISPENVESETGVCFNLYSEHDSEGVFFEKGDVLFNKLRLYLKKILLTDYDGFSLGEMIVLRTNDKLINKYFYQLLFSQGLIDLLDSQSTGIKLPRVSPDVILNTEITYPPLSEQQQIVEYLDEQTQKIDSSIQTEERKIELLKEYRQSLISSVVTGKIDVRPDKEIPWFQKPEPKVTVHKLKTPRNGIEEIVVTTPPIWEEKVFDIVLENLTIINSLCSSEIQFKLVSNYIIPVGYKPNNCILLFKDKKLNGVYYELKSWDSHKEWETTDGIFYEIIDEKIVEKDIVDRIFYWQFKELEKEGYNSYFIYYSKDRELMKTFSELKNIQLND